MIMKRIYINMVKMVAAFAILLAMPCCTLVYEWPEEHEVLDDALIKIVLDIPLTKAPVGDEHSPYDDILQHEGEDNILRLDDLEFYFFDAGGQYITYTRGVENVTLTNYVYENEKHKYTANIRVSGIYNGQWCRVVVLANRRGMYSFSHAFGVTKPLVISKPVGFDGTDEEYFYSQLKISTLTKQNTHNAFLGDYTMLNLNASNEACVPMWGVQKMEIKVGNDASVSASGEIDLLRSIAKVKVSIGEDLRNYVKIVDYQNNNDSTGVVLSYTRDEGFMTPSYLNARADTTWNSLGKDHDGLTYIDAHVNTTASTGNFHAPFFKDSAGDYYIYLTEQMIGEASINLRFQYTDPYIKPAISMTKKLHFADYDAARAHRGGEFDDIPLTDSDLERFKFPVMRNHYYLFTVTKIDPLEIKFEVCDWMHRSTTIEFN